MEEYKVMCVKYGFTVIEAENEEEAIDMAERLPDNLYSWHNAEEHQVIEI